MQESLRPLSLGAIESVEVQQLGEERDGCLGNTVTSLVSTISGRNFPLPPIYYAYRGMMIKDELRAYKRHILKNPQRPREGLQLAMHRLDQRVFKMLLRSIRTTGAALPSAAPIAAVLENCNVEYRKGDFSDILQAINSGCEVAVMYEAPGDEGENQRGDTWWHMAHIGISKAGEIVRLSDDNAPLSDATIEAINKSAKYLNQRARTWNFVAIKDKYA